MTTSRGADGGNPVAMSSGRHPAAARPVRSGHDAAAVDTGPVERPRFVTVVRGYDRIEVDEYVGKIHHMVTRLRSELTDAEDRRRRADQRVQDLENENRAVRARLDTAPAPLDEGFGVRAEKLLRLAEQEAAEVRSEAAEETAALRQQVREDIERQRHEAEQTLIARSAQFDEHAARRTAELQQREQQIAEHLTASRSEAEAVQSAARRAADHYRQRVEADVEQVKTRVNAEVTQIREQASQELDRLATLESGVRAELRRLSTRLTHEIARHTPGRGVQGDGGEGSGTASPAHAPEVEGRVDASSAGSDPDARPARDAHEPGAAASAEARR